MRKKEVARCHVITDLKGGKFKFQVWKIPKLDASSSKISQCLFFLTELAEQLEVERTQAHPRLGKVATLSLEGTFNMRNKF